MRFQKRIQYEGGLSFPSFYSLAHRKSRRQARSIYDDRHIDRTASPYVGGHRSAHRSRGPSLLRGNDA